MTSWLKWGLNGAIIGVIYFFSCLFMQGNWIKGVAKAYDFYVYPLFRQTEFIDSFARKIMHPDGSGIFSLLIVLFILIIESFLLFCLIGFIINKIKEHKK